MLDRLQAQLLGLLPVRLRQARRLHQRNADGGCLVDDRLGLVGSGVELIIVLLIGERHSCRLLLANFVGLLEDLLVYSCCFFYLNTSQMLSCHLTTLVYFSVDLLNMLMSKCRR